MQISILIPKTMLYVVLGLSTFLLILISCQPSEEKITKTWQGFDIDFAHLRNTTNVYHMYDSTDAKVGSMVFSFSFENGRLVCKDTSQFDNGSVYETAELIFDTAKFEMQSVSVDMQTRNASLDINLESNDKKIVGLFTIKKDTSIMSFDIDTTYDHSAFREEIYMMTHALKLTPTDTLNLKVLVSTSMSVSQSRMFYAGEETIETMSGKQKCDVIWLKADGKMPDNKIWVSQTTPRTIMKFYVPGPKLDIVLVSQW